MPDLVLGSFPVRDILDHAQGTDDAAGLVPLVETLLQYGANPVPASRMNAVLDLVRIPVIADGLPVRGMDRLPILRVDEAQKRFIIHGALLGREPEDAVGLVGPGEPAGSHLQLPAPHMGDLLGLVQEIAGTLELLFRPFPLGDVPGGAQDARLALVIDQSTRDLHGKLATILMLMDHLEANPAETLQ